MQLLDHLDRIQDRLARNAAFMLHQATERFYRCILLVLTRYSLKPPRSNRLRSPAERLDARLIMAWPRDTKFARRCFARPNRACVEARYAPHYEITGEELAWLAEGINNLSATVGILCVEQIDRLGQWKRVAYRHLEAAPKSGFKDFGPFSFCSYYFRITNIMELRKQPLIKCGL